MAKKLAFEFAGQELAFEMNKVDRARLYGYKSLEVLNDNDQKCEMVTLVDDGKTLIGKGGSGLGYITADGRWSGKSELKAVDMEGAEIVPVPSSFKAPIALEKEVPVDEYLDHNIHLLYRLESTEDLPKDLVDRLNAGAIFGFEYSYRGGLEPDAGFLLNNADGEVFFVVGDKTSVDFIGFQQVAPGSSAADGDGDDEDDLMDFDMI